MDILILQSGPSGPSGLPGLRTETGYSFGYPTIYTTLEGPSGPRGPSPIDSNNNPIPIYWQTGNQYLNTYGLIQLGQYSVSGRFSTGPTGPSGLIFVGPTGPMGLSGLVGISGPSGASGLSPSQCSQPNLQIYNFCFGLPGAYGPQGACGPSGQPGPSGISGPSGFSGAFGKSNIFCYVNPIQLDNLSGISGPKGISGPRGPIGISNIAGGRGISGPTGPRGYFGKKGPSGLPGISGDIGPVGFKGRSFGPSGASGPKGPIGPSGYSGPTSFQQGTSGPMGLDLSKGNSYEVIHATNDKFENGKSLLNAYNTRKSYSSQSYTIILTPGIYDFSGKNLDLSSNIKIVGFGNSDSIKIQSDFSPIGIGVVNQTSDDVYLENLSIQNTYSGANLNVSCPNDFVYCNVTSGNNSYSVPIFRNPNNNCEFYNCSGSSNISVVNGWVTPSGISSVFSSRQRCAFNNEYVNIYDNFNNKFEKTFDSNNKIAFLNLKNFFINETGSNGQNIINTKNLVFLKRSFITNLNNSYDRPSYISGSILDTSNYFNLFGQSTNFSVACRGTCRSTEPGILDYWVLVGANIKYDIFLDKILSISNEEILLIEKPKQLNVNGAYTSYFSFWPWNIQDFHKIATDEKLNQYGILLPYSLNLSSIQNSVYKNVKFLDNGNSENLWSYGMQNANYYGGKFINCEAGEGGFGGRNGYIDGEFINCKGGQSAFTQATISGEISIKNARIIDCSLTGNNAYGFGGSPKANIHGEFRNLAINNTGIASIIGTPISGSYIKNIYSTIGM